MRIALDTLTHVKKKHKKIGKFEYFIPNWSFQNTELVFSYDLDIYFTSVFKLIIYSCLSLLGTLFSPFSKSFFHYFLCQKLSTAKYPLILTKCSSYIYGLWNSHIHLTSNFILYIFRNSAFSDLQGSLCCISAVFFVLFLIYLFEIQICGMWFMFIFYLGCHQNSHVIMSLK